MNDIQILDLVYDIIAQNKVSRRDRKALTEKVEYIDYAAKSITIGGYELTIRKV